MSGSRVVCSVGSTTSWLMRLVSSPSRSCSKSGAFTPAAPDHEFGREAPRRPPAPRRRRAPRRRARRCAPPRRALPAACASPAAMRSGSAGRMRVGRLDQHDTDVAFRIDAVEPVGDHRAHGAVQLGGEFGAGGAGADDRRRAAGPAAPAPACALARRQALTRRRLNRVACSGVSSGTAYSARARRAEIVGDAADRDHQRVVAEAARRRDLPPLLVMRGGEMDLLARRDRGRSSRRSGS